MAMKEWFRQMQPVQLCLIFWLTLAFFIVQMIMSHTTHSLTLLIYAYYVLCNLIALAGRIFTIKNGNENLEKEDNQNCRRSVSVEIVPTDSSASPESSCYLHGVSSVCNERRHHHTHSSEEKRLKNTFGWARIDVLLMLVECVLLASLCFSVLVEAAQTLLHIQHHDEMHQPIPVMIVGAIGLLLNGLCYLMIGGYTFHQGSFLHITPSGVVVLNQTVNQDSLQQAENRQPSVPPEYPTHQGIQGIFRDITGCVVVIICSLAVYFTDKDVAKYVDPLLSIVTLTLLLVQSCPYMKESASILLQTIPDTIDIDSLCSELVKAFPDIINVHDLHIWRLTPTQIFSTAHVIFLNSKDFIRNKKQITDFFHDQGITHVTVQPEFMKTDNTNNLTVLPKVDSNHCLVQCQEPGCHSRHCCVHNDEELESVTTGSDSYQQNSKNTKKNVTPKKLQKVTFNKKISDMELDEVANMNFQNTQGVGSEVNSDKRLDELADSSEMLSGETKRDSLPITSEVIEPSDVTSHQVPNETRDVTRL